MAIDLSQFHQVFFEESFENIDIMESSLMELNPSNVDSEIINAIFRAAHSIKGGSATFGFRAIAGFTHILETLLDQIRSGERCITNADINLFFQSVDCMRELLRALQHGDDSETKHSRELAQKFSESMGNPHTDDGSTNIRLVQGASGDAVMPTDEATAWQIFLRPGTKVLMSGNDPLRLINELKTLGQVSCTALVEQVPSLDSICSEHCYLAWNITLTGTARREEIEETFAWIADESELSIEALPVSASTTINIRETSANESPQKPLPDGKSASQGRDAADVDEQCQTLWSIEFVPNADMLITGNDPIKLFNALKALGEVQSVCAKVNLPTLSSMNPVLCYLSWELLLESSRASLDKIEEVFEWVRDESLLAITPVSGIYETANKALDHARNEQAAALSVASAAIDPAVATPAAISKASAVSNTSVSSNTSSDAASVQAKPNAKPGAETTSIRVGIDKVDNLINMVGELVITQSMLGQLGQEFDLARLPKLLEGLSQLEQNTRELQESVMRIRMLPISFVFSRFPRMVRDLSQSLGKEVQLDIIGDQTELDKTVLEKIGDPLVHLVRNAVDHGIETVEVRRRKGKPDCGRITLNAYHQSGNVVIKVVDDGKGLDVAVLKSKAVEKGLLSDIDAAALSNEQAHELIFHPGFSTASVVSDVSGRGVGMDVVKRNIQALSGAIDIHSETDVGSTMTIRLPLTLAILDGQLVRVAEQTYIFPIVSIVESLQCQPEFISRVAGEGEVFRLRGDYVPIIHLASVFNIACEASTQNNPLMVVVETDGEKIGVVVDDLLAQQQVVIKSLEQNYQRIEGISGATILGDGTVALIVDIPGIIRLAAGKASHVVSASDAKVAAGVRHHRKQQHIGL